MGLEKASLVNVSVEDAEDIEVLFNPTEYSIDRGASFAELAVPGLETPILQYVRGQASTLSLELFLDRTESRENVEEDLAKLRKLVQFDAELHAPPVCRFEWAGPRFQGVVTSLNEKLGLFDEEGHILRARVTLTLKSYEAAEVQMRRLRPQSPDRTRVRVLRDGESLAQIAHSAYGDARLWRVIARANGIERPRFVASGTALRVPALPVPAEEEI